MKIPELIAKLQAMIEPGIEPGVDPWDVYIVDEDGEYIKVMSLELTVIDERRMCTCSHREERHWHSRNLVTGKLVKGFGQCLECNCSEYQVKPIRRGVVIG